MNIEKFIRSRNRILFCSAIFTLFANFYLVFAVEAVQKASTLENLSFKKSFLGTIGNLPLRMHLECSDNSESVSCSGSYYYKKEENILRDDQILSLEGFLDKKGHLVLKETPNNQNVETGLFKGFLSNIEVNKEKILQIKGEWSKPDGNNILQFTITEQNTTFSGYKIVTKKLYETNKKLKEQVSIDYPQLEGKGIFVEAFNAASKRHVTKKMLDFRKVVLESYNERASLGITYELITANERFVSILFDDFTDYGGAYPNNFISTLNFDLKTGKVLKLADLFKPQSKYIGLISKLGKKAFFGEPANTSFEKDFWFIEETGIVINYSVPHAAGTNVLVHIAMRGLKSIIDPEGVLGIYLN